MEVPASEPMVGIHDNADEKLNSQESCSSLARSDSGQGKSLSSVDFHEDNIAPDQAKCLETTTEIDDMLLIPTFEETTPLVASNGNAYSNPGRTVSCASTNHDSGIEKSPVSQHFTFPNRSGNHLQELSSTDMSYRKQQRNMFEGPVSDLSDVSKGRSGKFSSQRQYAFDMLSSCSLHVTSFDNDKPIHEQFSNNIIPSPQMSLLSSADCNGKCHHLVSTAETQTVANAADRFSCSPCNNVLHNMQVQTDVNGHNKHDDTRNAYTVDSQGGYGQPLTPTIPEGAIFNCRVSPQGMVPKSTLDTVVKELTLARRKISELNNLHKNNAALLKENREMHENWQLEVQEYTETLAALHLDVDYWKNKYDETKKQLETKESELQSKQDELNLKKTECQRLKFQMEGIASRVSRDENRELQRDLERTVHLRPGMISSDETQVKTT